MLKIFTLEQQGLLGQHIRRLFSLEGRLSNLQLDIEYTQSISF